MDRKLLIEDVKAKGTNSNSKYTLGRKDSCLLFWTREHLPPIAFHSFMHVLGVQHGAAVFYSITHIIHELLNAHRHFSENYKNIIL